MDLGHVAVGRVVFPVDAVTDRDPLLQLRVEEVVGGQVGEERLLGAGVRHVEQEGVGEPEGGTVFVEVLGGVVAVELQAVPLLVAELELDVPLGDDAGAAVGTDRFGAAAGVCAVPRRLGDGGRVAAVDPGHHRHAEG